MSHVAFCSSIYPPRIETSKLDWEEYNTYWIQTDLFFLWNYLFWKLKIDAGPPTKLNRKGGEDGKPKFKRKKFERGNKKPGKTGVKQFKSKQPSEKFTRKRKLQDDKEGGENNTWVCLFF